MKLYRSFLVLCLSAIALPAHAAGVQVQSDQPGGGSGTGTAVDDPEIVVWSSITGGGSWSGTADDIRVGGSIGQFAPGSPNDLETVWVDGGFWAPGEGDDSTEVIVTATELPMVNAKATDGGIEIRIQSSGQYSTILLDRGSSADGPWTSVAYERHDTETELVLVDPAAPSDRTWYYRIQTMNGSKTVLIGNVVLSVTVPIAEFALLPISPNPSRGIALVNWTVPRAANVRVTVVDVQGRLVATLTDGLQQAGHYSATWGPLAGNPAAAAGVYFVRMQTPERSFIRRVTMIP